MNDLFTNMPPSTPPPLEAARRRLEALQQKRDSILKEAEDSGADGELPYSKEWRDLCEQVKASSREVIRLESIEADKKQPK